MTSCNFNEKSDLAKFKDYKSGGKGLASKNTSSIKYVCMITSNPQYSPMHVLNTQYACMNSNVTFLALNVRA